MGKLWLALVLLVVVSMSFAAQDFAVEWHVHSSTFSDGTRTPLQLVLDSLCQVVVFSDHLDGIAAKGAKLYLDTIRRLSGTAGTLAIPAVEVTCGKLESSYDVIALGLNEESLDELISLYQRGAFNYSEQGLPALKAVANRYNLILIAAHPDSKDTLFGKGIPFHLNENAKYVDGFEMFDSNHIGFDADKFPENCLPFYRHFDRLTLTAGSDFHFLIHGSLPTESWREAPMTRVILDDDASLTEESITDSIRRGRTYVSSLRSARLVEASAMPGGVWKLAEPLYMACRGVEEGDFLYDKVNVIAVTGKTWHKRSFQPRFDGDKLVLKISADQFPPGIKSLNVDFCGRILTSTILTAPAPTAPVQSSPVASAPSPVQPTPQPAPQPAATSSPNANVDPKYGINLAAYKYRFRGTQGNVFGNTNEYLVVFNDDLKGKVWHQFVAEFPPIVLDVQLEMKSDGHAQCVELFDFEQTANAWLPNRARDPRKTDPYLDELRCWSEGDWDLIPKGKARLRVSIDPKSLMASHCDTSGLAYTIKSIPAWAYAFNRGFNYYYDQVFLKRF